MAGGENIALARSLARSAIARARSQEYEATFLIERRRMDDEKQVASSAPVRIDGFGAPRPGWVSQSI
eukprot:3779019-Pleurochrysis_carterae.AAC.1